MSARIKPADITRRSEKMLAKIVQENGRKKPSPEDASPAPPARPAPTRVYGKVVISLDNCVLPDEKLYPTPSMREGLDSRSEWFLRRIGCDLIQHAGILLKLPQTAMATAQVLYHRFYYARSFVRNEYDTMGMACVYLSSKVEEAPKRLRDIISVFTHVRQVLCNLPQEPVIIDINYVHKKTQVIKCERRLLKELGFCVHVKHPHKLIVVYLRKLFDDSLEDNQELVQRAWNYMNDSLRTDLFVRFSPEAIACACIFLAGRHLQVALPTDPAWYTALLKVPHRDVVDIANNIWLLYSIPLPPVLQVEQQVEELKLTLKKSTEAAKESALRLSSHAAVDEVGTPDSQQQPSPRRDRRKEDIRPRRSRTRSPRERDAKSSHHRKRISPPPRNSRRSRSRSPRRNKKRSLSSRTPERKHSRERLGSRNGDVAARKRRN